MIRIKRVLILISLLFWASIIPAYALDTREKSTIPPQLLSPSFGEGIVMYFLDVGQADATIIQCNGMSMMIDCGKQGDAAKICRFLYDIGVERLDSIIITHPHQDHMGGLEDILNEFRVDDLYIAKTNDFVGEENVRERYRSAIEKARGKGTIIHGITPYTYEMEDFYLADAYIHFLGPVEESYTDNNNMSLVLKIEYGGKTFLFPGDADREEITDIMKKKGRQVFQANVLHAPHHGGTTSNEYSFIKAVNPDYIILSVRNGSKDHPSEKTLSVYNNLIESSGGRVEVFRTDESHTIMCYSDGISIEFTENYQN